MKQVSIDKNIEADPDLLPLVRRATEVLDLEISTSLLKDEVSASWMLDFSTDRVPRHISLILCGEGVSVSGEFSTGDLETPSYVQRKMGRLWGDYLQKLSHKQIQEMIAGSKSDRFLDGSDALERIIDSMTEYSEREGREPVSLKLPVRYAAALMKLGPQYWGEFYRGIQKSGLRAFAGETVLGMKVELVTGVNAPLEVA